MKPALNDILTSVNYLPWKKVGVYKGVSYFDLLNDLGIGIMEEEAKAVREQLLLLERKRKVTLVRMNPPYNSHIIVVRPVTAKDRRRRF